MNHLDQHFHRAQSRLKSKPTMLRAFRGQSVVAPSFSAATGDSSYYEIPAIYRKRVRQLSVDNAARLAGYSERNHAYVGGIAA